MSPASPLPFPESPESFKPACRLCIYAEPMQANLGGRLVAKIRCRVLPPQAVASPQGVYFAQPFVDGADWCSLFMKRQVREAAKVPEQD